MEEYITAAATIFRGKLYWQPPPARHHNNIWTICEANPDVDCVTHETHGFITSTGRFVERQEAAIIALTCGQIRELEAPPNLFSEDLWGGNNGQEPPKRLSKL